MSTPSQLFDLSGLSAIVIGGTGVLCGAMASGLAAAGASVILVGRNEAKAKERLDAIAAAGGKARFVAAEATSRDDLTRLRDDVLASEGSIDILINGAGINSPTPFLDITDEEWNRIFEVNTAGVFRACQILGGHMITQPNGGSIINLGSISGLGPLSRVFTYSASKGAVHNLSKNLAREWAPKGVRVNTLVPGFFPAEQNRKVLDPGRVQTILARTPMGRFGEADELIGATLLLAAPKAGSFITGLEMVLDGGFHAMSI
jgi:NAD(P)-dependent dehydrogenase (short-subunit alcohol dehydrogenase family)